MLKKTVIRNFVQDDSFVVQIIHTPPLDLTGAAFDLTLKASLTSQAPALQIHHTIGDHPDDQPATGVVNIPVPGSATSAVEPGAYYGSIKRTDASGNTTTLIQSGVDGAAMVVCYPTLLEVIA